MMTPNEKANRPYRRQGVEWGREIEMHVGG